MIEVRPNPTADTRTCDFAKVTQKQLLESSVQHIAEVRRALAFFGSLLDEAAPRHDEDKLTDIRSFHEDFLTGFESTEWWDRHRRLNRHHLTNDDGIPDDVNLIDVLDFIADCVMAGMARSGSVRSLEIKMEDLRRAFYNTAQLLESNVLVAGTGGA